ncbi:MAG: AbrB family transcriptional regulator [Proteobacteria bacterium]|nr:AbrB family transcriptional regulator [Pseudomonadota bacterium]MBU2228040.1 AbrB family transcriptional regulator [Pseudomonadota bacterium]MBU2262807.1 AbrB family transcriptional regulator [Pseudomonadota bacterium]
MISLALGNLLVYESGRDDASDPQTVAAGAGQNEIHFTEAPFAMKITQILATFLIASGGGFLFHLLRIPLPWMLGPLTATIIYHAVSDKHARWPVELRNLGLIVIGYSMGRTVTLETTRQILANLPAMFAVTFFTVLFCLGIGYITHRRTGISLASGMLGSIPGGLAQMVLLTEEIEDADVTVVTFMQMTRVLAVVFSVPFIAAYGIGPMPGGLASPLASTSPYGLVAALPAILAAPVGAWLASRLKLPIPCLLGPIFATAAAVLLGSPAPPVPSPLMNLALIFFGTYFGVIITLESLRKLGKVFPYAIGGAAALLALTYLMGFGLTLFTPATLLTGFLSTAPGGLSEVGVVALALHADVAFIMAYQMFRLFTILLLVPPLLRWRFRR